mmetsp:Transcript_114284/g.160347  ORF Transcript_114284/g.160347 Transcript_114284/m.160347 type:complete len:104 (+) Transcript_114284:200-511(+)
MLGADLVRRSDLLPGRRDLQLPTSDWLRHASDGLALSKSSLPSLIGGDNKYGRPPMSRTHELADLRFPAFASASFCWFQRQSHICSFSASSESAGLIMALRQV